MQNIWSGAASADEQISSVSISCTSSTYSEAPDSAGGAWLVSQRLERFGVHRSQPLLPPDPGEGSDL